MVNRSASHGEHEQGFFGTTPSEIPLIVKPERERLRPGKHSSSSLETTAWLRDAVHAAGIRKGMGQQLQ